MSAKIKINIANIDYELNVAEAIQTGVLTRVIPPITDIRVGDVFNSPEHTGMSCVVILKTYSLFNDDAQHDKTWFVGGNTGVNPYSTLSGVTKTKSEIITKLNEYRMVLVGNINQPVSELINTMIQKYSLDK